jgi:thymidylate kinase
MAVDLSPAAWIADWAEDGTDITIPLASLPETDATEADGSTGDFRKVMLAWMEAVYQHYNGLATADRPVKMVVNRSTSVNDTTNAITRTYAVALICEPSVGGIEVKDEPS